MGAQGPAERVTPHNSHQWIEDAPVLPTASVQQHSLHWPLFGGVVPARALQGAHSKRWSAEKVRHADLPQHTLCLWFQDFLHFSKCNHPWSFFLEWRNCSLVNNRSARENTVLLASSWEKKYFPYWLFRIIGSLVTSSLGGCSWTGHCHARDPSLIRGITTSAFFSFSYET